MECNLRVLEGVVTFSTNFHIVMRGNRQEKLDSIQQVGHRRASMAEETWQFLAGWLYVSVFLPSCLVVDFWEFKISSTEQSQQNKCVCVCVCVFFLHWSMLLFPVEAEENTFSSNDRPQQNVSFIIPFRCHRLLFFNFHASFHCIHRLVCYQHHNQHDYGCYPVRLSCWAVSKVAMLSSF